MTDTATGDTLLAFEMIGNLQNGMGANIGWSSPSGLTIVDTNFVSSQLHDPGPNIITLSMMQN